MNQQHPDSMPANVSEKSWAFLGDVVRRRREFIGFSQEDLALYGGPKKTTVGKIERGAESSYSLKTQQQMEKALGWDRGAFRSLLSIAEYESPEDAQISANDYIEDELPDLTDAADEVRVARRASDLTDEELLAELTYRMKKYADEIERYSDVAPADQKIVTFPGAPRALEEASEPAPTTEDAMVALDDGSIAGEQESKNET